MAYQKEFGTLKLVAHNLISYRGEDLSRVPFQERLQPLAELIEELRGQGLENVLFERLIMRGKFSYFQEVVAAGGEGIVAKKLSGFESDFFKVKRQRTWDVVIVGWQEGKGKFAGVVGALRFGVFKDGRLVEVGKCGGLVDELRVQIAVNPEAYIGRVIEVEGQEVNAQGHIRFPRFGRFREDKLPEECTFERLFDA